jgi:hypothetical protein
MYTHKDRNERYRKIRNRVTYTIIKTSSVKTEKKGNKLLLPQDLIGDRSISSATNHRQFATISLLNQTKKLPPGAHQKAMEQVDQTDEI